jgi:hypothetical protein
MAQNVITYIHTYLCNKIVNNSEQQVSTAKLTIEICGESLSVIIVKIVLIKCFCAPEAIMSIVSVKNF